MAGESSSQRISSYADVSAADQARQLNGNIYNSMSRPDWTFLIQAEDSQIQSIITRYVSASRTRQSEKSSGMIAS